MAELAALTAAIARHHELVVAFSGGADSAFLARVAHDTLGRERVRAVTAVSPSLAAAELDDCRALAAEWGLRWSTVATDEMERRRLPGQRRRALLPLQGGADGRPGAPARRRGRHRPRRQHRTTWATTGRVSGRPASGRPCSRWSKPASRKADVRDWSRRLGLRTWDKPAAACLASRLPYGTEVTVAVLSKVERAEAALRALGFRSVRVRHYERTARVEVPVPDLAAVLEQRTAVVAAVRAAGYDYVTLDLEGLRSGNLNGALRTG